jgi:hypothetical protein
VCPDNAMPACGCDGKVYGNDCEANLAGVDINDDGGCQAPSAGVFACGAHFCQKGSAYCLVKGSDTPLFPTSYTCTPLPASCGTTPSCACLSGAPCSKCTATADGGLQVSCLGG